MDSGCLYKTSVVKPIHIKEHAAYSSALSEHNVLGISVQSMTLLIR